MAILAGLGFRLWHIDHKVYWHDEAYSTFRAAGYLRGEIDQSLYQGEPLTAPDLQVFQRLKPGSTYGDTLRSLVLEDPQHPPVYFFMARGWMRWFGNSILASRLLPVLISLGSLPLMYLLAGELFRDRATAWIATAFLALSPVDILFAQTARQYSLWTFIMIGSGWLLLRALRHDRWQDWAFYGGALTLGLYSHVFFLLNWISHGLFIFWQSKASRVRFALASGMGLLLFSPWLLVLLVQRDQALATTDWASGRIGPQTFLTFWFLGFSALIVDAKGEVIFDWTVVPRLLAIGLIGFSLWVVARYASPLQRRFVIATALIPLLLLVIPDLVLGGRRSTITRYLLGTYPGIQLALAYGMSWVRGHTRQVAQLLWGLILLASLTSAFLSARADTWWVKDLSFSNGIVADYLNQANKPLVITDRGDLYINTGDLLSLSYRLKPTVIVLPFPVPVDSSRLIQTVEQYRTDTLLTYRITQTLREALSTAGYAITETEVPGIAAATAAGIESAPNEALRKDP